MSLTGLITSGDVGPGYTLVVHTSTSGPFPNDDYAAAIVNEAGTGHTFVVGSAESFGSSTAVVTLGLGAFSDFGYPNHLAGGAAVDVLLEWHHASGTLVDSTNLTGFTWDPTRGLFVLVGRARGTTDGVLAAVTHTFPRTA